MFGGTGFGGGAPTAASGGGGGPFGGGGGGGGGPGPFGSGSGFGIKPPQASSFPGSRPFGGVGGAGAGPSSGAIGGGGGGQAAGSAWGQAPRGGGGNFMSANPFAGGGGGGPKLPTGRKSPKAGQQQQKLSLPSGGGVGATPFNSAFGQSGRGSLGGPGGPGRGFAGGGGGGETGTQAALNALGGGGGGIPSAASNSQGLLFGRAPSGGGGGISAGGGAAAGRTREGRKSPLGLGSGNFQGHGQGQGHSQGQGQGQGQTLLNAQALPFAPKNNGGPFDGSRNGGGGGGGAGPFDGGRGGGGGPFDGGRGGGGGGRKAPNNQGGSGGGNLGGSLNMNNGQGGAAQSVAAGYQLVQSRGAGANQGQGPGQVQGLGPSSFAELTKQYTAAGRPHGAGPGAGPSRAMGGGGRMQQQQQQRGGRVSGAPPGVAGRPPQPRSAKSVFGNIAAGAFDNGDGDDDGGDDDDGGWNDEDDDDGPALQGLPLAQPQGRPSLDPRGAAAFGAFRKDPALAAGGAGAGGAGARAAAKWEAARTAKGQSIALGGSAQQHQQQQQASCRVCQAVFPNWDELKAHIRAEGHHAGAVVAGADGGAAAAAPTGNGVGAGAGASSVGLKSGLKPSSRPPAGAEEQGGSKAGAGTAGIFSRLGGPARDALQSAVEASTRSSAPGPSSKWTAPATVAKPRAAQPAFGDNSAPAFDGGASAALMRAMKERAAAEVLLQRAAKLSAPPTVAKPAASAAARAKTGASDPDDDDEDQGGDSDDDPGGPSFFAAGGTDDDEGEGEDEDGGGDDNDDDENEDGEEEEEGDDDEEADGDEDALAGGSTTGGDDDADDDAEGQDEEDEDDDGGDKLAPLAGTPVFVGFSSSSVSSLRAPAALPLSSSAAARDDGGLAGASAKRGRTAPTPAPAFVARPPPPPPSRPADYDSDYAAGGSGLSGAGGYDSDEFFGKCDDMCPRKEREVDRDPHELESLMVELRPGWTLRDTMVKQYHRSAADTYNKVIDEVRNDMALLRTIVYLEESVMPLSPPGSAAPLDDVFTQYLYLENRCRQIMGDFSMQTPSCFCPGPLWVECHERIARFYIWSSHSMRQVPDFTDVLRSNAWQQNGEQLNNCLKGLLGLYEATNAADFDMPNRSEFIAYYLLNQMANGNEATRILKGCRRDVIDSPNVSFFLDVWAAYRTQQYARFFSLLRRKANFLQACVMFRYVQPMRVEAIKMINRHFLSGGSDAGSPFPVEDVVGLLMFESVGDCVEFLTDFCHMQVVDGDGGLQVILTKQNVSYKVPKDPTDDNGERLLSPLWLNHLPQGIDSKGVGLSPADICRGRASGGFVFDNEGYLRAPRRPVLPNAPSGAANAAAAAAVAARKKKVVGFADNAVASAAISRAEAERKREADEAAAQAQAIAQAQARARAEAEAKARQAQAQAKAEAEAKAKAEAEAREASKRQAEALLAAQRDEADREARTKAAAAAAAAEKQRLAAEMAERERAEAEARRLQLVRQKEADDRARAEQARAAAESKLQRKTSGARLLMERLVAANADMWIRQKPGLLKSAFAALAAPVIAADARGALVARAVSRRALRRWHASLDRKRERRLLLLHTLSSIATYAPAARAGADGVVVDEHEQPGSADSQALIQVQGQAAQAQPLLQVQVQPTSQSGRRALDALLLRVRGDLFGARRPLSLRDVRLLLEPDASAEAGAAEWSPLDAVAPALFAAQCALVRANADSAGEAESPEPLWHGDLLLKLAVVSGLGAGGVAHWLPTPGAPVATGLGPSVALQSLGANLLRAALCPPSKEGWEGLRRCATRHGGSTGSGTVRRRARLLVAEPFTASAAAGSQAVLLLLPAEPQPALFASALGQLCALTDALAAGAPVAVVVVAPAVDGEEGQGAGSASLELAAEAVALPDAAYASTSASASVSPARDVVVAAVRAFFLWAASGSCSAPAELEALRLLDANLAEQAFLLRVRAGAGAGAGAVPGVEGVAESNGLAHLLRYRAQASAAELAANAARLHGLLGGALSLLGRAAVPVPLVLSVDALGQAQEAANEAIWAASTIPAAVAAANAAVLGVARELEGSAALGRAAGAVPAREFAAAFAGSLLDYDGDDEDGDGDGDGYGEGEGKRGAEGRGFFLAGGRDGAGGRGGCAVPNVLYEDRSGRLRSSALPLRAGSWVDAAALRSAASDVRLALLPPWPADNNAPLAGHWQQHVARLARLVDEYEGALRAAGFAATGFAPKLKGALAALESAAAPGAGASPAASRRLSGAGTEAWRGVLTAVIRERLAGLGERAPVYVMQRAPRVLSEAVPALLPQPLALTVAASAGVKRVRVAEPAQEQNLPQPQPQPQQASRHKRDRIDTEPSDKPQVAASLALLHPSVASPRAGPNKRPKVPEPPPSREALAELLGEAFAATEAEAEAVQRLHAMLEASLGAQPLPKRGRGL